MGMAGEVEEVESAAHQLMASLVRAVSGDLGLMVRAIVGVHPETAGSQVMADIESSDHATLDLAARITELEAAKSYGRGASIIPPAKPVRWASNMLALCCWVYGQPIERAVPVGACLELLGITSSSLDAAQDDHHDLLKSYAPAYTGAITDMASLSTSLTEADPCYKQQTSQRPAALVSNASVAIIGVAWRALLEYGPRHGIESPTVLEIGQLIAERLVKACDAQHLDLTVGRAPFLSLDEYEEILEGKTGQIDGTVCEVGAVLAHANHHRSLWRTLGAERAIALQLYDDYRDFADDLLNDNQIGHPVLYGLAVADPSQRETILTLLKEARSKGVGASEAVRHLMALLGDLGAEYYTLTCMVKHRNRALAALEALQLAPEANASLYRWVLRAAPQLG